MNLEQLMNREQFRVGSLCKEKAPKNWHRGQILRVVKRMYNKRFPVGYQQYFLVGWREDRAGYGSWVHAELLRELNPLEHLALQLED